MPSALCCAPTASRACTRPWPATVWLPGTWLPPPKRFVVLADTGHVVYFDTCESIQEQGGLGAIADALGIVFPDQAGKGTHVNMAGAGVVAHAPNRDNAIRFIEYLVSDEAQSYFANRNNEYPVVPVEGAPAVTALGEFKAVPVDPKICGENQPKAQAIMDRVGWK